MSAMSEAYKVAEEKISDVMAAPKGPIREGSVAKAIEQRTARVPSDVFLWAACGAIGASAAFHALGRRETSNFIGQWAPTILILGLYNKLVKVAGSDRPNNGQRSNR